MRVNTRDRIPTFFSNEVALGSRKVGLKSFDTVKSIKNFLHTTEPLALCNEKHSDTVSKVMYLWFDSFASAPHFELATTLPTLQAQAAGFRSKIEK